MSCAARGGVGSVECAGFVLVGGRSTRMGRDKALLPWKGTTLAQYVARIVATTCGSAALVGNTRLHVALGYPIVEDYYPGYGPIGGIVSALRASTAPWSLIVGCDMPGLTIAALLRLLDVAANASSGCIAAVGPRGEEPLCAAYHRDCLPALEKAIAAGQLKMKEALRGLLVTPAAGIDPSCLVNVNTPEEFEAQLANACSDP